MFVEDLSYPQDTWYKFNSIYHTNTIADTMVILNKWKNLHMSNNMDVMTFMTKVYDIQRKLHHIGHFHSNVMVMSQIYIHILINTYIIM
uniref:Uncharacterized protein n=1 Tax=Physcomitrium patens TaxID=3218 RepID=A0A2K1J093_PHYPA|nr:hypothetical protein PHYPA_022839 [Physcomitrium patens]